jgi:hypothetical protein
LEKHLSLGPNFRPHGAPDFIVAKGSTWEDYVVAGFKSYASYLSARHGIPVKETMPFAGRLASLIQEQYNGLSLDPEPIVDFKQAPKYWMMDPSNPLSCIVVTTMDKFQDRYVLIC